MRCGQVWIDKPRDEPTSIWQRKFPKIGLCIILLELCIYLLGPTVLFYLGAMVKGRGNPEGARCLLQGAVFINGSDRHAVMARDFIRYYLPREPIPKEAIVRNVEAFNLAETGQTPEAEARFRQLMRDYPKFEWPYGNLAKMKYESGEFPESKRLCYRALLVNPDYLNAHRTLAMVFWKEKQYARAAYELQMVIDHTPMDGEAEILQKLLAKKLAKGREN